ncbi:MAG TPA: glycosyltransferase [Mucilaginibacter sp.]|jgi:hypothetical protein|nr:glycosyltransferase [Mucilaginibacter sp.]
MQRVRMSLPYFHQFGWDAEVVTIDPKYSDMPKDDLLLQSIPPGINIHYVKALNKGWTSKFGLGSIALRSLRFYKREVSGLLKKEHFDLIYFSTTQFPVCILGAYWKKRFDVPYVIDMQDLWHSDYYKNKPKSQRPKKYWFSYRLNKRLEPKAMRSVDGLISVSESYITTLKERYAVIRNIPAETITFGAFGPDMEIAEKHKDSFPQLLDPSFVNIVYIGRGGADMRSAITPLFKALKNGLDTQPDVFGKIKVYFIGTSYAPPDHGTPTISPLANELGVGAQVTEVTDRISYYHTLATLKQANALFIPGSDDPKYTASKIYPYVLTQKPLLAIFNSESPAIPVLKEYGADYIFSYDDGNLEAISDFLVKVIKKELSEVSYNPEAIKKYSAKQMAERQCKLFDRVAK